MLIIYYLSFPFKQAVAQLIRVPKTSKKQKAKSKQMLSDSELIQMTFLLQHLEERWSLKKRKHTYIMKRMNGSGSKKSYTSAYLDAHLSALAAPPSSLKQIQLLTFLHNALEDGWNIKKHSHAPNKFTFMKRHNGECTVYEDDEYLTRFIKNNLRMEP